MTMPHKLIQQASPRHPPFLLGPPPADVINIADQARTVDWTREVPSQPSYAGAKKEQNICTYFPATVQQRLT
jgi:hypothetical protein